MQSKFLLALILLSKPASYSLIFLGILFEGDIVLFSSMFLAQEKFFAVPLIVVIAYAAVLIRDTSLFHLGRHLHARLAWFANWANKAAEPFDAHIAERPFHSLVLSKFVYGLNFAIIMRAGTLGIPFKKFLEYDLLSTAVWIAVVSVLGYGSSASFGLVKHSLKFVEIALFVGLAILFILQRLLARYSKKHL